MFAQNRGIGRAFEYQRARALCTYSVVKVALEQHEYVPAVHVPGGWGRRGLDERRGAARGRNHQKDIRRKRSPRVAAAADFEELKESSKPKNPQGSTPRPSPRRSPFFTRAAPGSRPGTRSSVPFTRIPGTGTCAASGKPLAGKHWCAVGFGSQCPLFARSPSRLFPNPASFLGSAPYMTLAA